MAEARKRGSARMRQFGYKLVQVWIDAKEETAVKLLAREEGLPVAQLVRKLLCRAAEIEFHRR
jgi:hypothetical protein